MSLNELLQDKREDILRIAAKRGAYNVRVFGSFARGEADSKSDIDILVDMEPGRSLFDLGGLLMDLQDLLGHDVDVVTERGLRERILIGEATRALASDFPEFKNQHPEIKWTEIIGMRTVLAHRYFDTDPDVLWGAVTQELNDLKHSIDVILMEEQN